MHSDTMDFHTLVSNVQRASRGRSQSASGEYDSMMRDCDISDTELCRKQNFVILDIATSDRQIVPKFSVKAAPLCRFSVA